MALVCSTKYTRSFECKSAFKTLNHDSHMVSLLHSLTHMLNFTEIILPVGRLKGEMQKYNKQFLQPEQRQ